MLYAPLFNNENISDTVPGSDETMPTNIINEIPLPIPFVVIFSPNHINIIVPPTRLTTVVSKKILESFIKALFSGFERAKYTPNDWIIARNIVRYLVYWLIFALPYSPSFFNVSSAGCIDVNNCMIIDEVIYGIIFNAKILILSNAPPENRFIIPKIFIALPENIFWIILASIPGIGTNEPNL